MDDSRHTPRISLAEASMSEMMAELQVRESKYGRSERSKPPDMRRSLEDSSNEDAEDQSPDEDQSGSDYADPYHSDEHDRHVSAANGAERRTEAIGTEEVNEVNTTVIEKERNGSFGGGESNERKNEEWNSGGSEGLVSSVTKKTGMTTNPRIVSPNNFVCARSETTDDASKYRDSPSERCNNQTSPLAKVTLGWNQEYEYELWVMDHGAGVDVVLGMDFMIPADVRLDLFQATARLPDEVEIPLIKTQLQLPLLLCVPRGGLPRTEGYVRLGSDKYNEWRVLAYSRSSDSDLYKAEGEIFKRWLAAQPSQVERVPYTTPTTILRRPSESSEGRVSDRDDQAECDTATTEPSTEMVAEVVHQEEARPKLTAHSDRVSEGSEVTQLKVEGAYLAAATESDDWGDRDAPNASEHPGNDIEFEDYARELAFLPDLTEAASTTLDYTGPHVRHPSLSVEQQDRVVKVLKSHERIMISSGNALPPPAYGVVQDIDVQEHTPTNQKARRIPLRHLKQLYKVLKGLLKAGLIAFSNSPWASPIVIVLKENGVDIRLCTDYKMVNSVTSILEYAMPLVDDLLTDMEKYLWYCSLDAGSGFWAVMMTQRARVTGLHECGIHTLGGRTPSVYDTY
ncbi:unnamed protein product [Phytophthora fragariaefolia]|uniref:Unnamed protein product n=1 Tax=Phytophthora fragariaefolia TaxID=1490495 RepID=A0A9W6U489_9STRA|nr:unnamed protein product [Phytophthora fragariaefolia]